MSVPTIVICQCCEYQLMEGVEQFRQDIDIGYVCMDCYTQLKWAQAHLKVSGIKTCSKFYNNRIK